MDIKILASSSKGNAYIISDGKTNLLIDCGISYNLIMAESDFMDIDACLISHSHKDHCKGVGDLIRHGIPVYVNQETFTQLLSPRYNLSLMIPLKPFQIGTFRIHPFDLKHDVENTGFMIQSIATGQTLVYITDTAYCKYSFSDINYWLIECNYVKEKLNDIENIELRNRIVQNHMSLETCVNLIKSSGFDVVKQIYLLHLSSQNSDEKLMRETFQKLTGKEIYINY